MERTKNTHKNRLKKVTKIEDTSIVLFKPV
jgi:hypothetical protein